MWSPVDGQYVWDSDMLNIINSSNNTFVISGMTITGAGVQSVDVAAGVYMVGGTRVTYAGGTIAAPAADVTNPRKDILVADNAGALTFTQGTAASALPVGETGTRTYQPIPPNITTSRVFLAEVYRAANDNTILTGDITEKFIITPGRMIGRELLTEQGDIIYASAAQIPAALPHGTSGYFLKTQGHGANPIWAEIPNTASQSQPVRVLDTVYQNTSGKTRIVVVSVTLLVQSNNNTGTSDVGGFCDASNPPTTMTAHAYNMHYQQTNQGQSNVIIPITIVVPPSYYYKFISGFSAPGVQPTVDRWTEWDLG